MIYEFRTSYIYIYIGGGGEIGDTVTRWMSFWRWAIVKEILQFSITFRKWLFQNSQLRFKIDLIYFSASFGNGCFIPYWHRIAEKRKNKRDPACSYILYLYTCIAYSQTTNTDYLKLWGIKKNGAGISTDCQK